MFNVDDLAYINAYRKSMTSTGTNENKEPIIFGNVSKQSAPFSRIVLSEDQRFAIERAKNYALDQSISNALRKQNFQLQTQDMNSIKQNQALVLLSRIYVGSISFEIGEEEIRKSFSPFGPIKSIALSWDSVLQKHKGFAFVEFEIPEAASLVLEQMNGFMIAGRGIKVGRPSNAPQTAGLEAELRQDQTNKSRIYVAGVHSELSESDIQTVFEAFGKVSSCTLETDIKFGQPSRHKNYGWIEFETEQGAIDAVASMNGFELAGQLLRVGRALSPKNMPSISMNFTLANGVNSIASQAASASAVAAAAASISARVMALDNAEFEFPLENSTMDQMNAVMGNSPVNPSVSGFSEIVGNVPPPGIFIPTSISSASPIVAQIPVPEAVESALIPNSATANSLWDEDDASITTAIPPITEQTESNLEAMQAPYSPTDLSPILPDSSNYLVAQPSSVILLENMVDVSEVDAELEDEVSEECTKYGNVLRVIVHFTNTEPTTVKIFVHFDCQDGANAACLALNDRYFGGRLVVARLYPDEEFQMQNFEIDLN